MITKSSITHNYNRKGFNVFTVGITIGAIVVMPIILACAFHAMYVSA
ncbi:MAG: hypothetical protein FWD97_04880 [Defluviitaleaceae bacterium]|nr:hypothetical protein [Defluviitaleaceae bacterium]